MAQDPMFVFYRGKNSGDFKGFVKKPKVFKDFATFVINFKCVIQHKNIQTQKTKNWPGSDFPKKYSYSKKNRGNPNHQIFKSFF